MTIWEASKELLVNGDRHALFSPKVKTTQGLVCYLSVFWDFDVEEERKKKMDYDVYDYRECHNLGHTSIIYNIEGTWDCVQDIE